MSLMSLITAMSETDQFANLFGLSPNAVLITDPSLDGPQQRIRYVNPAFERMTGWSLADLRGLTPAVLQGPETDRSIFQDLRETLERGAAWQGETVNYRRDGTPFTMAWSISPIRGSDGSVAAFLALQEDVTQRRLAEQAVRESERRYRAIFEQSFQLIGVLSPDGTLREVNETALRFAELAPSQVLNKPFWEGPWWQACATSRARLREAITSAASGTLVQFRARCFGRNARIHELDVSIKPVCDEHGRIVMLIPEGRDMTQLTEQKRRLRRETARLRNAQRIGRMGGWDYDVATGIFHNEAETLELFDLPQDAVEMTRADLEGIIHPDDLELQRTALDSALETGARYDVSFRITTRTGDFVVNAVGEPVLDASGRVTGLAGIVQDITERHRVQQELIKATKAAEAASEAKSRFLATMGHELRTPLNAINGFSELMAQEALGPLGRDEYRVYCQHVLDSGRHLLDLINNRLDATWLELGRVEPQVEQVVVQALIEGVAGQMHATAAARGVEIKCRDIEVAQLMADPRLLRQVLFNLIGNAIKFAPADTVVEVSGKIAGDGGYRLSISDAGPGIPENARERVQQAFQQVDDSLARRHEGVGLGLYIVNRILDAHGGRLTIGASSLGGAEVSAILPPTAVRRVGVA